MRSSQQNTELDTCLEIKDSLAIQNEELRKEVERLKSQLSSLKVRQNERKSILWKKIQNSIDCDHAKAATVQQRKPATAAISKVVPEKQQQQQTPKDEESKPTSATPVCHSSLKMAPPPPPPPPLKSMSTPAGGRAAVRRVPQVVDLYRSLTTRKDHPHLHQMDSKSNAIGGVSKNMIGEIENRSSYLSAVKSEVETQGRFINLLITKVEQAAFTEISDVETFVNWLDDELSSLVDERAVLKHFPRWPERKADAMREAAFSYRDLKNVEFQVESFRDDPTSVTHLALNRIQGVQDRLETSINNIERTREITAKKYRELQIPWKWMLQTGYIGQMKLTSLRLAKEYMKRVVRELSNSNSTAECRWMDKDRLVLQGVRFAFRVHQFVGGFDDEAIQIFDQLKNARQGKH